jgi:hypothetical protein
VSWVAVVGVVASPCVALLMAGVGFLVRDAYRHRQDHDDVWEVLSSLADESGDEKWRIHRIERRMHIDEPAPKKDTRALIDQINARRK